MVFEVVAAANTLRRATAGADADPAASVAVYWTSTVPENPATGVKVKMHVVALTVTAAAEASGRELLTRAQVNGPVPEGIGSATTTGPEFAGAVVEIDHATGMMRTVALAAALAVPYWSVAMNV